MDKQDVALQTFTDVDDAHALATYIAALESFDAIPQLQALKALARARINKGTSVLDVGCGFGLETERLVQAVGSAGRVCGIDKSEGFIAEARRRAERQGLSIAYEAGDATALPYGDGQFDVVRAERLLIYIDDPAAVLREMKRVARPGAEIAVIEPDLTLTSVNLPNRDLVRRVLAHECDVAVRHSWLPGRLTEMLAQAGFADISLETRVLVIPQDLAANYFTQAGETAQRDGKITADELAEWRAGLAGLHAQQNLFCTIGYFLFMARA